MTLVKKSRVIGYSCQQMFDLVDRIEDYGQFLPYCSQSVVHHRGPDEVQATLVISAAGLSKSFTTHNRLQHNKMIEIRLIDGPFSQLEGFWRFDPITETDQNSCRISFDLEFEFSGRLFAMVLGPVFDQVTNKMVDAFCDRAEQLYGTNSTS